MSVTSKSLLFTLVVPGTVVGLFPWLIVFRDLPRAVEWHRGSVWIGLVACLFGAAVYARCTWEFAVRGRGTPAPFDPPKQLVVSGLYRLVRNPMYLSILVIVVGEALLLRSRGLAIYLACLASGFHVRVVFFEEPALRRLFADSFARYRAEVPRWLPLPPARSAWSGRVALRAPVAERTLDRVPDERGATGS